MHTYICMYVLCVLMYIHTCIYANAHLHMYMYTYMHMCMHMYASMDVCKMSKYVHNTYIHVCLHT